jgi:hypothetical protein
MQVAVYPTDFTDETKIRIKYLQSACVGKVRLAREGKT